MHSHLKIKPRESERELKQKVYCVVEIKLIGQTEIILSRPYTSEKCFKKLWKILPFFYQLSLPVLI